MSGNPPIPTFDYISEPTLNELYIDKIVTGEHTPRTGVDVSHVEELKNSIRQHGLLVPILVQHNPFNEEDYFVIDGEHRIHACLELGYTTIKAQVYSTLNHQAAILALEANLSHGKPLNDFDIARLLKKLHTIYRMPQKEIGERFGKSQSWASQKLALLENSSKSLEDAIITRVIASSLAREIIKTPKELQPALIEKINDENLNYKQVTSIVKLLKRHPEQQDLILNKPLEDTIGIGITSKSISNDCIEETCPNCGKRISVIWKQRTLKWCE